MCDTDTDVCSECRSDSDCEGFCVDAECVECRDSSDCDDGSFCNVTEIALMAHVLRAPALPVSARCSNVYLR